MKRIIISLISLLSFCSSKSFAGQPGLPPVGLRNIGNGHWEVTTEKLVSAGDYALTEDPACNIEPNTRIQNTLKVLLAASTSNTLIKTLAGPILDAAGQKLDGLVRQTGGDIGGLISPNRVASCAILAVKIPTGSTIHAIKYMAGDGDKGVSDCPKDGHGWPVCGVGWCRWEPAVSDNNGVAAVFKNWSADRQRWASLTVEFSPPAGVTPQPL